MGVNLPPTHIRVKAHLSSFRLFWVYLGFLIWAHLGLFWAHIGLFWIYLGSFELILAFGSFRVIWTVLRSFRLIWVYLGSFRLLWLVLSSFDLHPFNLGSFQPVKYILEEITLIHILLIRCKLYAVAVNRLQFPKNFFSNLSIFVLWFSLQFPKKRFSNLSIFFLWIII